MTIHLPQGPISGSVRAISSKSAAHRLMICAALADTPTQVRCQTRSRDMTATQNCLAALAAGETVLPCGESGSTLRFLLPVAAALGKTVEFQMQGRLPERPLAPLDQQLTAHGAVLSRPARDILRVEGQLTPGDYTLPGDVSSQYISGLLFALPLLDGPSTLTITGPVQSAPYIAMTLDALNQFGVTPRWENGTFEIVPSAYRGCGLVTVEGDWSNAAFWLCAGALSGPVTVTGLRKDSLQGDRQILDILRQFGAHVRETEAAVTVSPGELAAIELDAGAIPDLIPVVSVVAAAARGITRITNAARLRLKESDRLQTVTAMLTALGATVEELPDGLVIHGGNPLTGGTVDSANDHRIAMAAGIASALCPVTVTDAQAVEKSYPTFWEELRELKMNN